MVAPIVYPHDLPVSDERFWRKVDKNGPLWGETPCWLWTGACTDKGYGILGRRVNGRPTTFTAHRYAYLLAGYPIPEGYTVDHLCRRPNCCNPAHLEPVTNTENQRRGRGSRTHCRYGHLLTPDNLLVQGKGRYCRQCRIESGRRSSIRQRQRLPRVCKDCGELRREAASGLCWTCYSYRRRTGSPRMRP